MRLWSQVWSNWPRWREGFSNRSVSQFLATAWFTLPFRFWRIEQSFSEKIKTNALRLLAALFPFLTHRKLPLKLVLVFLRLLPLCWLRCPLALSATIEDNKRASNDDSYLSVSFLVGGPKLQKSLETDWHTTSLITDRCIVTYSKRSFLIRIILGQLLHNEASLMSWFNGWLND